MRAATLAGTVSTVMFVGSTLPTVIRAVRTREVSSYSRGALTITNAGNAVHTVYVASLPAGPVWLLHLVHTGVAAFMLAAHVWWAPRSGASPAAAPTAAQRERERTRGGPAVGPRAHGTTSTLPGRQARTHAKSCPRVPAVLLDLGTVPAYVPAAVASNTGRSSFSATTLSITAGCRNRGSTSHTSPSPIPSASPTRPVKASSIARPARSP